MTVPMTVTALGMVARWGGRSPGGAGREPFLRIRRWRQLCSPPSPPASLLAELRLVLGEVESRASCLHVAARRFAQMVCLPGAPSSCGLGVPRTVP